MTDYVSLMNEMFDSCCESDFFCEKLWEGELLNEFVTCLDVDKNDIIDIPDKLSGIDEYNKIYMSII